MPTVLPAYTIWHELDTPSGMHEYYTTVKGINTVIVSFPAKVKTAELEAKLLAYYNWFILQAELDRRESQKRTITVFDNQVDAALIAAGKIAPPTPLPTPIVEVTK